MTGFLSEEKAWGLISLPCEDIARKQPSASQEEGLS